MYLLYNIALYVGFLILSPRFLYDAITKGKYAAGFDQRIGNVPQFDAGGRRVVLLHCVSVGEANAALPLARKLKERFPETALVVSTTTKTGQVVARTAYAGAADLVVYFPFDFGWAVKRFLARIGPDVILLTETELWFNFIRLTHRSGAKLAIVNGRLSERSFRRYTRVKGFMKRMLGGVDLALMQGDADADRLRSLGAAATKVEVTGNLKFDISAADSSGDLTNEFSERFALDAGVPLILAASTHEPEEKYLLESLEGELGRFCRLMMAPRHPERFAAVERLLKGSGHDFVRRSTMRSEADESAAIILLDSIGELRAVYPLAEIVFVGGSLIPHGGQSIFEPAAAGKAIVTGPYTGNFDAAVREFLLRDALVQLPDPRVGTIAAAFADLLRDQNRRRALGKNALAVIEANRGAVDRTLEYLKPLLTSQR